MIKVNEGLLNLLALLSKLNFSGSITNKTGFSMGMHCISLSAISFFRAASNPGEIFKTTMSWVPDSSRFICSIKLWKMHDSFFEPSMLFRSNRKTSDFHCISNGFDWKFGTRDRSIYNKVNTQCFI